MLRLVASKAKRRGPDLVFSLKHSARTARTVGGSSHGELRQVHGGMGEPWCSRSVWGVVRVCGMKPKGTSPQGACWSVRGGGKAAGGVAGAP